MAKKSRTEEAVAQLGELGKRTLTEEDIEYIRASIANPNRLIVGKAAKVVAEKHLREFAPELTRAFARFMEDPADTDKGCYAKLAILETLVKLEADAIDVFRRGVRHVQREPVFGGYHDTAAPLRAICAMALARQEVPDVFFELVALLADPEPQARAGAVRALTYMNEERAELLLRLKVLVRDREPAVLSECFAGLMSISAGRSLPLVASFLDSQDILIAEGAALALGESRSPAALDALLKHREAAADRETRTMLLLPIALSRSDVSFDYLLKVVAQDHSESAAAAVRALKIYAADDALHQRIHDAVAGRGDSTVSRAYESTFPKGTQ
ncbi:MAG: HEAT repeat domain-containing protein [Acidobacteriota bacterium]